MFTYNMLLSWVCMLRRAGRACADVIQIAQLILSNFGDNYFLRALPASLSAPLASPHPHPLLLPTQQLDSASSNTCGSDSAWLTSPQWPPTTCPIPCTAWDLGSLSPWSPFTHMMASARRVLSSIPFLLAVWAIFTFPPCPSTQTLSL